MEGFFNRLLAACRKNLIFGQLLAIQGCTAIFDGDRPLKMRVFRKPHCQTGCLNAAERRDARERRSKDEGEKAMEGFFNRLLVAIVAAGPALLI
jgi:hypothetical protein